MLQITHIIHSQKCHIIKDVQMHIIFSFRFSYYKSYSQKALTMHSYITIQQFLLRTFKAR